MGKITFRLAILVVLVLVGGLILAHFSPIAQAPSIPLEKEKTVEVSIKSTKVTAAVADTESAREQGLSGRASLGGNDGMLFVFPADETPSFWMKEMSFPLDFIWLDAGKKVTEITPDVSPSTYPQTFSPSYPIRYVLEVNAGFAAAHQITTGDQASW